MEKDQIKLSENPYYKANILSKIFNFWTWKIYWNSMHRDLNVNDCFKVKTSDQAEILGRRLEKYLQF